MFLCVMLILLTVRHLPQYFVIYFCIKEVEFHCCVYNQRQSLICYFKWETLLLPIFTLQKLVDLLPEVLAQSYRMWCCIIILGQT